MSGIHSLLAIHGPTLGATPVKGAGDSLRKWGARPPASGTGLGRGRANRVWSCGDSSSSPVSSPMFMATADSGANANNACASMPTGWRRLPVPGHPPTAAGSGRKPTLDLRPGQLVIVDEASMAPPRTSTTSPPSQHGQGRRAPATLTSNTYLQHGRVESGTREDMLDLLFEPGSPTRAPVGSRR